MRKLLYSPWQTLGIPFALPPIGQPHQSPPLPVPGTGRAASGGALDPEPPRATGVGPEFPRVFFRCFPLIPQELRVFWTIFPEFLKSDVSHPIFPKLDSCPDIVVRIQFFSFFFVFFARIGSIRVHRPRKCNNKPGPISGKVVEILSDLGKKLSRNFF